MPDGAMMVDPGEAKVLERPGSERLEEACVRVPGVHRAGGHLIEEFLELFV